VADLDFAAIAPECVGKTPYQSEQAARRILNLRKRFRSTGTRGKARVYQCTACGNWHIGSEALK